jgi:hypothetical protein
MSETDYPAIRRVMGPVRERLDDEELENVLETVLPGTDPDAIENFMSTVQQFGKQAAPLVKKVGPGIAQGAMQGATVGGPWGALAGAVGGGATSLLSPSGTAAAPGPAPVAGVAPPAAPSPGPLPGGSPIAPAQLLALLSRPETMQALLALVMAQLGRSTVPVGGHAVPAVAFANAISELAAETAEVAASANNGSTYWFDAHGAPRCDVANPAARAALLWSDLVEAAEAEEDELEEELEEEDWEEDEWEEPADEEDESPIASFEAALNGGYAG